MASRAVYRSGKDKDGDITSLCGDFGKVVKADAIAQIEYRLNTYYVPLTSGAQAQITVVNGSTGKYLRSNWDGTQANNLDSLPDC